VPASITRRRSSGTIRSGPGRSCGSLSEGALTWLGYLALGLSSNALACRPASTNEQSRDQAASQTIVIVEPAAATTAPNATVESASEALEAPHCARGYKSTGTARLDVVRLSALCGGSNGMQASESIQATPEAPEKRPRSYDLGEGDCIWAVAAGEPKGVASRVRWSAAGKVVADCELRGAGWCPPEGPLCASSATRYEITLDLPDAELVRARIWRRRALP
jgi:hypothetical protein